MNCIYSHEGGEYCDKHDHGAVTVGCCGEENCPDREVLTKADGYVLRSSVLSAIHNGDIDMGMVTPHEYRLLEDLSRRIDRRIQRVPVSDVRPVARGRWIEFETDAPPRRNRCSECGYITNPWLAYVYNYCPNCGADMMEVDE